MPIGHTISWNSEPPKPCHRCAGLYCHTTLTARIVCDAELFSATILNKVTVYRSYCSLLTIAHVITAVAGSESPRAVDGALTSAENTAASRRLIWSWNTFYFILFYFIWLYFIEFYLVINIKVKKSENVNTNTTMTIIIVICIGTGGRPTKMGLWLLNLRLSGGCTLTFELTLNLAKI